MRSNPYYSGLQNISVLLLESGAGEGCSLASVLANAQKGIEVFRVADLDSGIRVLRSEAPHVILYSLSRGAAEMTKTIESLQREAPLVPVIVLLEEEDDSTISQVLESGAQDFLVRGSINETILARSIRHAARRSLAMVELETAKMSAQLAAQSRTEFLCRVSHELRTPLNGILGLSELLVGEDLDPEHKEYAQLIHESAIQQMHVVNDILDFSRLSDGSRQLRTERHEIRKWINHTLAVMLMKAQDKGLELVIAIEEDVPRFLLFDGACFGQVLINLVSNSIKFTKSGGITVQVRLENKLAESCRIMVAVTDSGLGVPQDHLGQIFDPFCQVEEFLTRKYGGTGLGLSIVKELVELMGGSVSVQSIEGQGSAFCVELDIDVVPEYEGTKTGSQAIEVPRPRKILVVEDNLANQKVLTRILEEMGHAVTVVGNGQEAIAQVMKGRFDLILMDVQMPVMDGFQATRAVRDFESGEGIRTPIIAITAHAMDGDRESCLAAGMDDYLAKPVTPQELREVVVRSFSDSGSRQSRHGIV